MKKNYLLISSSLFMLFVLSACATIDGSLLETAETLPKGKVRVTGYTSSVLMVHSFFSDYLYDPANPDQEEGDGTISTPGLKLNYGLTENTDLVFSTNLSNPLNNARLGLKYALNEPGETFRIALMPSVYYGNGEDAMDSDVGGTSNERMDYRVLGAELPLLVTYRTENAFAVTLSPRIAYNKFYYRRAGENLDWDIYESYVAGLVASPSLRFGIVTITAPELGVYFYPVKEEDYHVQPTLTFGVGMEF
ncbi:MAG: hypothetical protein V3576_08565 [Candidatus Cloacimonadota bacterium]